MSIILKNILAILLYIWAIPFQLLLIIITTIGWIPLWLCGGGKILTFKRNQKQWKITRLFEQLSDRLETIIH